MGRTRSESRGEKKRRVSRLSMCGEFRRIVAQAQAKAREAATATEAQKSANWENHEEMIKNGLPGGEIESEEQRRSKMMNPNKEVSEIEKLTNEIRKLKLMLEKNDDQREIKKDDSDKEFDDFWKVKNEDKGRINSKYDSGSDDEKDVILDQRRSRVYEPNYQNVRIEPYDPKEPFYLFKERFECMLEINGCAERLKLPMLKLHLRGRVASEVLNRTELNSYSRITEYLLRNYIGEESVAAARYKLEMIRIKKRSELIYEGTELSRLVDIVYERESFEERMRRKRILLAEKLPQGILRSLVKHGRPENEPFDHMLLVAKDYWDDLESGIGNFQNKKEKKFSGNCHFCKKKGHKEAECRVKEKEEKKIKKEANSLINQETKGKINENKAIKLENSSKNLPIIQVKINDGEKIRMLVDTGSEITVLPLKFKCLSAVEENYPMKLKTLNDAGTIETFKTKKKLKFSIGDQVIESHAFLGNIDFSKRKYDGILGWNIFKKLTVTFDKRNERIFIENHGKTDTLEMNVAILEEMEKSNEEVLKIKKEFQDVIAKNEFDLGSGKMECQPIQLKINAEFPKPANIPVREWDKPILKEYLDKLEKSGVIEKKTSPYALPIIIIPKKDGRKRIIGDMRAINAIVQPIYYSPPLINQVILKMRNCNFYTKLDCNNSYFQVSVPIESRKFLAVKTPFGIYQFKRLVQGYINSCSEYQRIGEEVLQGLEKHCTNYLDDIVIHTSGPLEFHIKMVKEVLKRIRSVDWRISFEKCNFFGKSIKYLGFLINEKGSIPHTLNIELFLKRPFPETKKTLKSLVAAANYYRNYIKDFSEITYPLDELLKKKYQKLVWNERVKESYKKLVEAMSNPNFCHHPVLEEDFFLTTDSSDYAIGGVLSQIRNGEEISISFYSKRLSVTKRRRCITYKELIAISKCFKHFKYYFGGSRIYIKTDHLPLLGIFKNSTDNKYLELTNELFGFDYKIVYLKGSSNVVADDLSSEVYKLSENGNNGSKFSGKEVNNIKCVNVNELLKNINIDEYDIMEIEPIYEKKETEDLENSSEEMEVNTNPVHKLKGEKKRKRGRLKKVIKEEEDDGNEITLLVELIEDKYGFLQGDFKKYQKEDIDIITASKEGIYDGKEIEVKDGVNYVKIKVPEEGQVLKKIIPKFLEEKVLFLAHNLRGHFGKEKTKKLIESIGYMKSIDKKVEEYIAACEECQKRNSPYLKHPKMEHVTEFSKPFENLSMDICGPILPTSYSGNKYILVLIDSFSRYTIINPCRAINYNELLQKILDEVIWKHGNPLSIRSDNAKNFRTEKLTEIFQLMGIKREFSSVYHSRGNCLVERTLRWIQNTLAKLTKTKRGRWDIYTQAVAYYYNTTVCAAHGYTPFFIHYLRNPNSGLEKLVDEAGGYQIDRNLELVELLDVAKETYENVKKNIEESCNKRKQRKWKINDIKENDFVYVRIPNTETGEKLVSEWKEPFKVIKVNGNKINVLWSNQKKREVHFSNCKRSRKISPRREE
ncbi:Reverse transcriptase domain and Integrase, catalytic core domain and Ribonuclease H-like domain and Peptidase A2A, retrovirus RVP subgroup domain and Aspartic peptidase domain-containing protein [Strongyloides ratti]|uniref:RNA-directed DNA polymerase n=1 Tax=Strongyloides ratti TaxID=34506 RepID=A0A090L0E9_STRRB|nr:Reverse transcriptase domain and Integrase, catalytic core domain and Ribonuclease H-like domain and Peptidase A2A, retrovirus RVP subgroup domain and Aspartic peptidase domain-containing protein [Strongyloides ratti]CEF61607.1 Reverse transcriptase domain and Integrase, catalytic core domain and Ribonuclease H-like domain and Peptidase A2A, retrovirus RVP subgroup domain and Aspartic peptidase domain-containing protein [Strongyloides ratti]